MGTNNKGQRRERKSIKKFCEDAGISRYAYFYWQWKLREKALSELTIAEKSTKNVPDGWIRLNPEKPQRPDESISIEINCCHITVKGNTDLKLLTDVCGVVKRKRNENRETHIVYDRFY